MLFIRWLILEISLRIWKPLYYERSEHFPVSKLHFFKTTFLIYFKKYKNCTENGNNIGTYIFIYRLFLKPKRCLPFFLNNIVFLYVLRIGLEVSSPIQFF